MRLCACLRVGRVRAAAAPVTRAQVFACARHGSFARLCCFHPGWRARRGSAGERGGPRQQRCFGAGRAAGAGRGVVGGQRGAGPLAAAAEVERRAVDAPGP